MVRITHARAQYRKVVAMNIVRLIIGCGLLAGGSLLASDQIPAPAQSGVIALTGATVYPVSSAPIPNGTIVFVDGKITAIGNDVTVPAGAQVVDVTGKRIYPGIINAYTRVLKLALRWRAATITLAVTTLVVIVAIYMADFRVIFLPETEPFSADINVSAAEGTDLETTDALVRQIEDALQPYREDILFIVANVGRTGSSGMRAMSGAAATPAEPAIAAALQSTSRPTVRAGCLPRKSSRPYARNWRRSPARTYA